MEDRLQACLELGTTGSHPGKDKPSISPDKIDGCHRNSKKILGPRLFGEMTRPAVSREKTPSFRSGRTSEEGRRPLLHGAQVGLSWPLASTSSLHLGEGTALHRGESDEVKEEARMSAKISSFQQPSGIPHLIFHGSSLHFPKGGTTYNHCAQG